MTVYHCSQRSWDTSITAGTDTRLSLVTYVLDRLYFSKYFSNTYCLDLLQCGGAQQAARCPECNAPIGGTNYQLHQSNTRAMEFEAITR